MKKKLYNCLMVFVIFWVMGEVFKSSYSQNLIFSLCMVIAYAIWDGLHLDIYKNLNKRIITKN